MIRVTLVTGSSAAAREAAIAGLLDRSRRNAVILEGIPGGADHLGPPSDRLLLARIAAGCICCTGNLVLQVTLNRLLKQAPECLYIGIAAADHLDRIRAFLAAPPYDALLELTADMPVAPA